jgi:enoyl-CoA hydratase
MADEILTELIGSTLVVTLNRPAVRNAIDAAVLDGLLAALGRLDSDPACAAGVLTGAGGTFSAGLDLRALAAGMPITRFRSFIEQGTAKPIVAAVEGFALGGGLELALACDLIVAASDATFGAPEVRVGLIAAGGALLRLPTVLPRGLAMKLVLTGDRLDASDAAQVGLVTELTPSGGALAAAIAMADRMAANAPLAVAASKAIIRSVPGRSESELWELQKPYVKSVFASADAAEGARAFSERRQPNWSGH